MGVLRNARYEAFAQHIALQGKSISEAYEKAGFKAHRGNAARLRATEPVRVRIEELLAQQASQVRVTKEWVLSSLLDVAQRCMGKKVTLKGSNGQEREVAYRFDSAGANRALELLGKELGMFVERSEVDTNIRVISAQPVSEADWEAKYSRVIDHKKTN